MGLEIGCTQGQLHRCPCRSTPSRKKRWVLLSELLRFASSETESANEGKLTPDIIVTR